MASALTPVFGDLAHRLFAVLELARADHDVRAGFREPHRHLKTDAGRTAGDDADAPVETH